MKLTPWTLTVATFLMVGGIAVSYFFKNPLDRQLTIETKRVYFDGERMKAVAPPQNTNAQDVTIADAADVNSIDVLDIVPPEPDKATRLIDPEPVPPEMVPERLIAGNESDETPVDVAVPLPPPVLSIEPPVMASQEPELKMPAVSEGSQPKSARAVIEKPSSEGETKGFVTEQYRSIDRTDVRFVQGRVITATQVATKSETSPR